MPGIAIEGSPFDSPSQSLKEDTGIDHLTPLASGRQRVVEAPPAALATSEKRSIATNAPADTLSTDAPPPPPPPQQDRRRHRSRSRKRRDKQEEISVMVSKHEEQEPSVSSSAVPSKDKEAVPDKHSEVGSVDYAVPPPPPPAGTKKKKRKSKPSPRLSSSHFVQSEVNVIQGDEVHGTWLGKIDTPSRILSRGLDDHAEQLGKIAEEGGDERRNIQQDAYKSTTPDFEPHPERTSRRLKPDNECASRQHKADDRVGRRHSNTDFPSPLPPKLDINPLDSDTGSVACQKSASYGHALQDTGMATLDSNLFGLFNIKTGRLGVNVDTPFAEVDHVLADTNTGSAGDGVSGSLEIIDDLGGSMDNDAYLSPDESDDELDSEFSFPSNVRTASPATATARHDSGFSREAEARFSGVHEEVVQNSVSDFPKSRNDKLVLEVAGCSVTEMDETIRHRDSMHKRPSSVTGAEAIGDDVASVVDSDDIDVHGGDDSAVRQDADIVLSSCTRSTDNPLASKTSEPGCSTNTADDSRTALMQRQSENYLCNVPDNLDETTQNSFEVMVEVDHNDSAVPERNSVCHEMPGAAEIATRHDIPLMGDIQTESDFFHCPGSVEPPEDVHGSTVGFPNSSVHLMSSGDIHSIEEGAASPKMDRMKDSIFADTQSATPSHENLPSDGIENDHGMKIAESRAQEEFGTPPALPHDSSPVQGDSPAVDPDGETMEHVDTDARSRRTRESTILPALVTDHHSPTTLTATPFEGGQQRVVAAENMSKIVASESEEAGSSLISAVVEDAVANPIEKFSTSGCSNFHPTAVHSANAIKRMDVGSESTERKLMEREDFQDNTSAPSSRCDRTNVPVAGTRVDRLKSSLSQENDHHSVQAEVSTARNVLNPGCNPITATMTGVEIDHVLGSIPTISTGEAEKVDIDVLLGTIPTSSSDAASTYKCQSGESKDDSCELSKSFVSESQQIEPPPDQGRLASLSVSSASRHDGDADQFTNTDVATTVEECETVISPAQDPLANVSPLACSDRGLDAESTIVRDVPSASTSATSRAGNGTEDKMKADASHMAGTRADAPSSQVLKVELEGSEDTPRLPAASSPLTSHVCADANVLDKPHSHSDGGAEMLARDIAENSPRSSALARHLEAENFAQKNLACPVSGSEVDQHIAMNIKSVEADHGGTTEGLGCLGENLSVLESPIRSEVLRHETQKPGGLDSPESEANCVFFSEDLQASDAWEVDREANKSAPEPAPPAAITAIEKRPAAELPGVSQARNPRADQREIGEDQSVLEVREDCLIHGDSEADDSICDTSKADRGQATQGTLKMQTQDPEPENRDTSGSLPVSDKTEACNSKGGTGDTLRDPDSEQEVHHCSTEPLPISDVPPGTQVDSRPVSEASGQATETHSLHAHKSDLDLGLTDEVLHVPLTDAHSNDCPPADDTVSATPALTASETEASPCHQTETTSSFKTNSTEIGHGKSVEGRHAVNTSEKCSFQDHADENDVDSASRARRAQTPEVNQGRITAGQPVEAETTQEPVHGLIVFQDFTSLSPPASPDQVFPNHIATEGYTNSANPSLVEAEIISPRAMPALLEEALESIPQSFSVDATVSSIGVRQTIVTFPDNMDDSSVKNTEEEKVVLTSTEAVSTDEMTGDCSSTIDDGQATPAEAFMAGDTGMETINRSSSSCDSVRPDTLTSLTNHVKNTGVLVVDGSKDETKLTSISSLGSKIEDANGNTEARKQADITTNDSGDPQGRRTGETEGTDTTDADGEMSASLNNELANSSVVMVGESGLAAISRSILSGSAPSDSGNSTDSPDPRTSDNAVGTTVNPLPVACEGDEDFLATLSPSEGKIEAEACVDLPRGLCGADDPMVVACTNVCFLSVPEQKQPTNGVDAIGCAGATINDDVPALEVLATTTSSRTPILEDGPKSTPPSPQAEAPQNQTNDLLSEQMLQDSNNSPAQISISQLVDEARWKEGAKEEKGHVQELDANMVPEGHMDGLSDCDDEPTGSATKLLVEPEDICLEVERNSSGLDSLASSSDAGNVFFHPPHSNAVHIASGDGANEDGNGGENQRESTGKHEIEKTVHDVSEVRARASDEIVVFNSATDPLSESEEARYTCLKRTDDEPRHGPSNARDEAHSQQLTCETNGEICTTNYSTDNDVEDTNSPEVVLVLSEEAKLQAHPERMSCPMSPQVIEAEHGSLLVRRSESKGSTDLTYGPKPCHDTKPGRGYEMELPSSIPMIPSDKIENDPSLPVGLVSMKSERMLLVSTLIPEVKKAPENPQRKQYLSPKMASSDAESPMSTSEPQMDFWKHKSAIITTGDDNDPADRTLGEDHLPASASNIFHDEKMAERVDIAISVAAERFDGTAFSPVPYPEKQGVTVSDPAHSPPREYVQDRDAPFQQGEITPRAKTRVEKTLIFPPGHPGPFVACMSTSPEVLATILSFLGDPTAVCKVKAVNRDCRYFVEEHMHDLIQQAVRIGGISMRMRPAFWMWVAMEQFSEASRDLRASAAEGEDTELEKLERRGRCGKWHQVIERDVSRSFGNLPPHKTGARLRTDSIVRALVTWGKSRTLKRGVRGAGNPPPPSRDPSEEDRSENGGISLAPTDTVSEWGGVTPAGSFANASFTSEGDTDRKGLNASGGTRVSDEMALSGNALTDATKAILQGKLSFVLHALAAAHPEVGYCQGMDYVVAHLLRLMQETVRWAAACKRLPGVIQLAPDVDIRPTTSEDDVAKILSVIDESLVVEEACFRMMDTFFTAYNLGHFYWPELRCLKTCCLVFEKLIQIKLPVLADHFEHHELNVGLFALGWFQTLFLYLPSMPTATVSHMWDIWLVERSFKIFFRVATAILFLSQPILLNHELDGMMSYLNTFPDATLLSPDILIACALQIKVTNKLLMELELQVADGA